MQNYTPLAPILASGLTTPTNLAGYLQNLFLIGIALAGAMAVFMIVLGGIQYMSTDAISKKADGKVRIQNALEGLALVLLCWIIMYTINPNLVGLDFNPSNKSSVNNNGPYRVAYYEKDSNGNITNTIHKTADNMTACNQLIKVLRSNNMEISENCVDARTPLPTQNAASRSYTTKYSVSGDDTIYPQYFYTLAECQAQLVRLESNQATIVEACVPK